MSVGRPAVLPLKLNQHGSFGSSDRDRLTIGEQTKPSSRPRGEHRAPASRASGEKLLRSDDIGRAVNRHRGSVSTCRDGLAARECSRVASEEEELDLAVSAELSRQVQAGYATGEADTGSSARFAGSSPSRRVESAPLGRSSLKPGPYMRGSPCGLRSTLATTAFSTE